MLQLCTTVLELPGRGSFLLLGFPEMWQLCTTLLGQLRLSGAAVVLHCYLGCLQPLWCAKKCLSCLILELLAASQGRVQGDQKQIRGIGSWEAVP